MRPMDLALACLSAASSVLTLLIIVLSAQWLSFGTLLVVVLLLNAMVRLRLVG